MDGSGVFDFARCAFDDLIIRSELLQPRLYAFLLGVVLALVAVVALVAASSWEGPLSYAVGMGGVSVAVLCLLVLFLLSDVCIVEMLRDSKSSGVDLFACLSRARSRFWPYALALIPVLLCRMLLGMVLSVSIPVLVAEPYSTVLVQFGSVLVDAAFFTFFVFLLQSVVLERAGALQALGVSVKRGLAGFWSFFRYVVFRVFLGGMVELLLVLPLVFFLFKLGYPEADLAVLDASSAVVLGALAFVYSGLKMVVLDSFLVVMDTHAFSGMVPRRSRLKKR